MAGCWGVSRKIGTGEEWAQSWRSLKPPFCAQCYVITDNPKLADGLDPEPMGIPRNGPLTALAAVLPLQVRTSFAGAQSQRVLSTPHAPSPLLP